MTTLDGVFDTTYVTAGGSHDIATRHVASLKLAQTALDDLAGRADLREVLLAMGLKQPPSKVVDRSECGTATGWDLHKARDEKPCRSCSAAHALAARQAIADRRAARLVEKPIAHGTPAGFMAHYRRGEQPCLPCVDAEHARKTQPPKTERRRPPCGTRQGYEAHCRRKEDKCAPCKAAKAVWRREQLAEERAAREKATVENRARIDEMIASLPLGTSEEAAAERGERVDALLDQVLGGVS
jgi:hypothetical protein